MKLTANISSLFASKRLRLQPATLRLADMQKTILDGVAAWSHGPLADDGFLVIVEAL